MTIKFCIIPITFCGILIKTCTNVVHFVIFYRCHLSLQRLHLTDYGTSNGPSLWVKYLVYPNQKPLSNFQIKLTVTANGANYLDGESCKFSSTLPPAGFWLHVSDSVMMVLWKLGSEAEMKKLQWGHYCQCQDSLRQEMCTVVDFNEY